MNKMINFLYGLFAYIIFLVSFIYAVGFFVNILVPKSIDSGTETPFFEALLTDIMLLFIFAIQHSIMARPRFKKWWIDRIGAVIERSTYVLLSSLALGLIFWQWQPITLTIWKVENELGASLLLALYFLGWLIAFLSTFMINHFNLFGLKQVFENLRGKPHREEQFKTNFLYKLVRHPLMLGFIIAFWATPVMTLGHLCFSIIATAYILAAVKFLEEKDLLKTHGKDYQVYQKEVPMIFPFTGKRK